MSNYLGALSSIITDNSIGVNEGATSGLGGLLGKTGLKSGGKSFATEMMLADKMFGGDSSQNHNSISGGFDSSIFNDALVLEALEALSSVKGLQHSRQIKAYGANNSLQSHDMDKSLKALAEQAVSKSKAIGELSAQFESGSDGSGAIGYDRVGGTSYGKYQIASKTGTMDEFLNFLKKRSPELAERLISSGPANTGGTEGAMPEEWKKIASENPKAFEALQHDFIKASHYDPAAKMILEQTGIDINKMPDPVKDVLWSTSVQHGATGAGRMIAKAVESLASNARDQGFPVDLVKEIYGERRGKFGSSTAVVQNSVQNRLKNEEKMVISMLQNNPFSKVV